MGLRRLRLGLAMLTYQDWLLFCFVLGVLGGTAAALAFGGPVVQGCILGAAGTAGGREPVWGQGFPGCVEAAGV